MQHCNDFTGSSALALPREGTQQLLWRLWERSLCTLTAQGEQAALVLDWK